MLANIKSPSELKFGNVQYLAVIGIIVGIGILLPNLGRPVDFGLHARIWGAIALLLTIVYAVVYRDRPINLDNKFDIFATISLFALCIFYASTNQLEELFNPSLSGEYSERKLAILFYTTVLPAIMVRSVLIFKRDYSLFYGVILGAILVSIVATLIVIYYWDFIFMASSATVREFRSLNQVSTIALSLVFTIAYFSAFAVKTSRRGFYLFKVPYLLFVLVMIIILSQRAHLVLVVLLTIPLLITYGNKRDFIIIAGLFLLVAVVLLLNIDLSNFSDTKLSRYWNNVLQGKLFDTRIPIYQAAFDGILSNPWGGGLAAFAVDYPKWAYPHNPVLDAFYELGIIGGILMIVILLNITWLAIKLYWKSISRENELPLHFAYSCILISLLLHQLKAGSIDSLGLLLIMWFITQAYISYSESSQAEQITAEVK